MTARILQFPRKTTLKDLARQALLSDLAEAELELRRRKKSPLEIAKEFIAERDRNDPETPA